MTHYFDHRRSLLDALAAAEPLDTEAIAAIEEGLVRDATIAAESPGFPPGLRAAIHAAVCKHGITTVPWGDADDEGFVTKTRALIEDLHTIFHAVAHQNLPGLNDNPTAYLETLMERGTAYRAWLHAGELEPRLTAEEALREAVLRAPAERLEDAAEALGVGGTPGNENLPTLRMRVLVGAGGSLGAASMRTALEILEAPEPEPADHVVQPPPTIWACPIKGGELTMAPAWCEERGAKNWAAVITGKNPKMPNGLDRRFIRWASKGRTYPADAFEVNQPVMFAGDLIPDEGPKKHHRVYGVVCELTPERIAIELCDSGHQALLRAAERAAGSVGKTRVMLDVPVVGQELLLVPAGSPVTVTLVRTADGFTVREEPAEVEPGEGPDQGQAPWVLEGVSIPHGTPFRAKYRDVIYRAVVDNGALLFEGERHRSPSGAAMAIGPIAQDKRRINGWDFWRVRPLGAAKWVPMSALRLGPKRKWSKKPAESELPGDPTE